MTWLVFDIGSGSAKAALIRDGQILDTASAAYPTHQAAHGVVEQEAADWWHAAQRGCHALAMPADIEGIVLTGQMQNVILLDDKNQPVRPVILYSDTRATGEMDRLHDMVGEAALTELTGNAQTAGSLLAKLQWLARHEATSLDTARTMLFGAADYVAAR